MTDRTTIARPLALRPDAVITTFPDERETARLGKAGRWIVTTVPQRYSDWVRVDIEDEATRQSETWILPFQQKLTVELHGRALMEQAAALLADVAVLERPEMARWEVTREGLRGDLACGLDDVERVTAALADWQADDFGQEIIREPGRVYTRVLIRGVVRGVPVEIGTVVKTPEAEPVDEREGEAAA
ncbi:hypothetical protein [Streptomyces halstedii]|uniref:hypothetical protein n=1 Tax=Streptomyces halstedii TaxID=1944 RepID=UPI00335F0A9F